MKKNLKWLGLGGMVATALLFAMNLSAMDFGANFSESAKSDITEDLVRSCMNTMKKDCQSWAMQGGGSEAPRGLKTDTKVELALNERYILAGVVEFQNGIPFLRIDFRSQPWLANRTRVANPYYRISGNAVVWQRLSGRRFTIVATAKYSVYSDQGQTKLEIFIAPVAEAVLSVLKR